MKKKTNYVVVVDYYDGQYLEDAQLLGWDNQFDWYDNYIDGQDIIDENGEVVDNEWGLIHIDRNSTAYVGEEIKDCVDYAKGGIKEGIDCTVCKLETVEDGIKLIPQTI